MGFHPELSGGNALSGFSAGSPEEGYSSLLLRRYCSSRQIPQALRMTTVIRNREELLTWALLPRGLTMFRALWFFH
ncbi:MAG: hypothetical protein WCF90_10540 [Methanomicrobiales archaeon]